MADQPGTIEVIARELASALEPLKDKLAPDAAPAFLGELGLNLPSGFATASTAISGTAVKAGALAPLIVDLVDAIDAEDAGSDRRRRGAAARRNRRRDRRHLGTRTGDRRRGRRGGGAHCRRSAPFSRRRPPRCPAGCSSGCCWSTSRPRATASTPR